MRVHCNLLSTVGSYFLVSDSIVLGATVKAQISTRFSANIVEVQEVRTIVVVKTKFFHVKVTTKYIICKYVFGLRGQLLIKVRTPKKKFRENVPEE